MKYIVCLMALMLSSSLACANSISHITVGVEKSGRVHVKETITVSDINTLPPLTLPSDASEITVYDTIGPLSYQRSEAGDNLVIENPGRSLRDVAIEYSTNVLTSKSDSVWRLSFKLPTTASRTIIKIEFPSNSTIFNWTPYRFSVGPADILYIYPDVDETNFTATYQFGGEKEPPPTPPDQPVSMVQVAVAAVVLIVILAVYVILRRRSPSRPGIKIAEMEIKHSGGNTVVSIGQESVIGRPVKGVRELKESVERMLEDNERKVLDVLASHDEEITQAQIYHTTGIPKASLSDIMNRMERRNLIERTKDGRVKWVKLKKWVYK